MEIERKYLVKTLPNLEGYQKEIIEQGYICEEGCTLRVRMIEVENEKHFVLTYKAKVESKSGARVNVEEEFDIPEISYSHLLSKSDGNIIRKTRTLIPLSKEITGIDGLTAELDVFEGALSGIIIVEVEFESEEDSVRFCKPNWFGEDVSGDPKYSNSRMIWQ